MTGFKWWDKLQAAEAKVVARARAFIFLVAGGGFAFAQTIDDPAWIKHAGNIAFAVCGALALLLRAGEKNDPPPGPAP